MTTLSVKTINKAEIGREYWFKGKVTQVDEGDFQPYKVRFGVENEDYLWISEQVEMAEVIPDREKVTIPKFVADWIAGGRENGYDLAVALDDGINDSPEDVWKWLGNAKNQEIFARAWLDGYEVEKELLYTVEIPNPNKIGNEVNVLMMNGFRQVVIVKEYGDNWKKENGFRLTESEIKKDFEWAWQFAVPVEENDE